MESVVSVLKKMGAIIENRENGMFADGDVELFASNVQTDVYPGFPTDLQSPMVVLMTRTLGSGKIKETI